MTLFPVEIFSVTCTWRLADEDFHQCTLQWGFFEVECVWTLLQLQRGWPCEQCKASQRTLRVCLLMSPHFFLSLICHLLCLLDQQDFSFFCRVVFIQLFHLFHFYLGIITKQNNAFSSFGSAMATLLNWCHKGNLHFPWKVLPGGNIKI